MSYKRDISVVDKLINTESKPYVGFVPSRDTSVDMVAKGQLCVDNAIIEKGLRKLVFTDSALKGSSPFNTALLPETFGAAMRRAIAASNVMPVCDMDDDDDDAD